MAFTRAPVQDAHNAIRVPVTGTNFIVSDPIGDDQPNSLNYINCFPLQEKQWNGEPRQTVHRRQAFEKSAASSGTVDTAGVIGKQLVMAPDTANYQTVFFAKNSTYYMFNYGTKVVSSVGTSATAAGAQYASGTVAVNNSSERRICFLDGNDELKTFAQDGTGSSATVTGRNLDGRRGLVFLNGYLFAVGDNGYHIFNSNPGGVITTWNSTDYIAAEQYADPILWLDKHKNHLVAFGSQSTEFFYDGAVEIGSPLVRQQSYSRRIGIYTDGQQAGKITCSIGDDLYFLGCKENGSVALHRIRDFQIEEIACPYAEHILNKTYTDPKTTTTGGIETLVVNNQQMVLLNIVGVNHSLVYIPSLDTWWLIRQGSPAVGNDFGEPPYRVGTQFFSPNRGYPIFLQQDATDGSVLYYCTPDFDHSTQMSMTVYTPVVDLGINFQKHIVRVDAVGDFGSNNTITMKYNPSPQYETSFVTCTYTRTPGTDGYNNAASWYNLGPWRRGIFSLTIVGYDHTILEGLDVEYVVGMS